MEIQICKNRYSKTRTESLNKSSRMKMKNSTMNQAILFDRILSHTLNCELEEVYFRVLIIHLQVDNVVILVSVPRRKVTMR